MKKNGVVIFTAILFLILAPEIIRAEGCEMAIEFYNKGVIETDPTIKEAMFLLALHENCPDSELNSKALNNLADVCETKGELIQAIHFYNESIMANRDYALPYFGIGDVYFGLGDYYSAYVMYKKGFELDPTDEETKQRLVESENKYKKEMRVYFDVGSTKVSDDYIFRLDLLAEVMKESKDTRYVISGYTDDVGDENSNRRLSKKRAEWVRGYLVKKDVDPKRLTIEYFGEERTIIPNDTNDGRTLNRRAQIWLIK